MATPNYGYEKRQKELAKRKKKEDKLRAKAERKTTPGQGEPGQSGQPVSDESQSSAQESSSMPSASASG